MALAPTSTSTIPGPGRSGSLSTTLAFQRDPLGFLSKMLEQYGNVVRLPVLGMPMVVINHPDDVKKVLQDNHVDFDKDAAIFELVQPLLGDGLISVVGGASWMSRRRLIQPSFHRKRIEDMTQVMLSHSEDMLRRWSGFAADGTDIDVGREMSQITLRIVARTLFAVDIGAEGATHPYAQALEVMMKELSAFLQFPIIPLRAPTPGHRRFWKNIRIMDGFVYDMIGRYRAGTAENQGDLLYMLMNAQDADTGEKMDDRQLRDEITSFLFAGHETSANALTWTIQMLTEHPDVESRLREEIDRVVGDREPTMADLPKLSYLTAVINENLRVNPPIWQIMRHARVDGELGGYRIPAGSNVFWSPYLVHRNPDFWPDPEKFDPDRFAPDLARGIHKGAFIPFSAGPRICIGNTFAMTEIQLILTRILQRFRFESRTEQPLRKVPNISLWPDKPIRIALQPR
ncbi:cytochrome P450 [Nocardia sp. NBC_00508]|uniref:cytochrome P450 n=1 Tax=Nocardia sp. NBC_00508 TaxID=2975992 RepID=UPI002E7FE7D3|nr:cytochrome P450 [Nocardia sp. NBC_00508]WUD64871.1 cytochrome P450 [Nocardia sp. NBC_00508]